MKKLDTDFMGKIRGNLQGYRGNLEKFGEQLKMPIKGSVLPPMPLIPSPGISFGDMHTPVFAPGIASAYYITFARVNTLEYESDYMWSHSSVEARDDLIVVVYSNYADDKWYVATILVTRDELGRPVGQVLKDSGTWSGDMSMGAAKVGICRKPGTNIFVSSCGQNYTDSNPGLYVQSHIINVDTGIITAANYDSLKFSTAHPKFSSVCHVAGDVFVAIYSNFVDADGWAYSFTCDDSGNLTLVDSYEYDPVEGGFEDIYKISDSIVAILWRDTQDDLRIITLSVDGSGNLGDSPLSSATPANSIDAWPGVCRYLRGNIYAIAYSDNTLRGQILTLTIDPNTGLIGSVIDVLEFTDTDYDGRECHPFRVHDGLLFISHDNGNYGGTSKIMISAILVDALGDNLTLAGRTTWRSGDYSYDSHIFSLGENYFDIVSTDYSRIFKVKTRR